MLRDIRKGDDAQIAAIVDNITQVAPDVLLLTDFDYDYDAKALMAFAGLLDQAGVRYDHHFAARPNTGVPTDFDLDGDGWVGDARDAQGYGRFGGDGGMAILSRWPIDVAGVQDFSQMLWRDLAGAVMPMQDGQPFPSQAVQDIQRLSTAAHWIVPVVRNNDAPFHLMAWSATPPVFDGPEDRNGLRNRDELRLWENILNDAPPQDFIVLGNANLDPVDGAGLRPAMAQFLQRADLRDPQPRSQAALAAADPEHMGDAGLDTADWPDAAPGNLRVSYVLPSVDWTIVDSAVHWPQGDTGIAGAHHLVWVDISR